MAERTGKIWAQVKVVLLIILILLTFATLVTLKKKCLDFWQL